MDLPPPVGIITKVFLFATIDSITLSCSPLNSSNPKCFFNIERTSILVLSILSFYYFTYICTSKDKTFLSFCKLKIIKLNTRNTIVEIARKVIKNQSKAINKLADFVDDEFAKATELIFNSKGRVVVTGVGKSAIIANKIVATVNSTGTPSIFLHAADAIHGDLGIIQNDDIVICISKSGNTPEVKVLLPLIKNNSNKVIAITSHPDSYLGKNSDFVLNSYIEKEACPHNLAPTTSTTAQLVIGDALAICLLDLRGFSKEDFAKFHPGGSLGKRLYLRVNDISSVNMKPQVSPDDNLKTVIVEISEKMLGITAVVENNKIIGVITDGDIRRMLKDRKSTRLN